MVAANPAKTHLRARVAALTRAVRNGERSAGDPTLEECRRELAALRLAEYVEETVRNWPPLTEEQLDHIAGLLRAGRP
jgi:hypothetical protein